MTPRAVLNSVVSQLCRQHALRILLLSAVLCLSLNETHAQQTRSWLTPADSLHKGRFWAATGTTAALYTATIIGLNEIWYKQFPRSDFHFFNDWKEWNQMDKMGHLYTAYFESQWVYSVGRWTGMSENAATWAGAGMGVLLQGTIEFMDAYSDEWGFSIPDFAFNVLGAGTFFTQQKAWGEQRILLKVSSTPRSYSDNPIPSTDLEEFSSIRRRTNDLFGTGFFERFIKDYNAQTVWASVNVASFLQPESRFPKWLNAALGYGTKNMYGGFENLWMEDDVTYDATSVPRPRQWYLSLDVDFTKIPSNSPFVRTLLGMLNVFKMPAPAIEYNTVDGIRLHAIHF